jgi:hypothetical protein
MGNTTRDRHIENYEAVEQPDGSWLHKRDGQVYWYNEAGQVHREDGPAVIYANKYQLMRPSAHDEDWYLNGEMYSFDKWCIALNITDEAKMLLRLQYE